MKEINASNEAVACYVTVERAQGTPEPERAMPAICESIRESAAAFLGEAFAPEIPSVSPLSMLSAILKNWAARVAPKPLVVLINAVAILQDQAMVSFLRQLRGGLPGRGVCTCPASVVLVGMRGAEQSFAARRKSVMMRQARSEVV